MNDANKCFTSLISLIKASRGAMSSLISKSITTTDWSGLTRIFSGRTSREGLLVRVLFERFDDVATYLGGVLDLV
jgi:hypothetical protein